MKTILKLRWPISLILLVITVVLFWVSPDLAKQAEEAGTIQLSKDSSSQIAASILEEAGVNEQSIVLVVQLSSDLDETTRAQITTIANQIEELGEPIASVINPVLNEQLEKQLVSEDLRTIMLPIKVKGSDESATEAAQMIREILPSDLTTYITGTALITNDVNNSAQAGLKRTEIITVILIFALLLAVFRSIVTPFIPLLAVGVAYLLSQSIVAFFIDWFGFPVSNYTQIFLVAILFGIGTDYCILLLSRYKEHLSAGHPIKESIINTYQTAGRTLLISAFAVFIGFLAIGFADFPIFKSAVGVAVGIVVLILVLFTILPLFMMIFKEKLFWPSKKAATHNDSKLWLRMSKLSINHPFISILVVGVITIPVLFTYNNSLSYNSVDEISSDYESVQGLKAIEQGFGNGNSLPVQIIIKSDSSIVNDTTIPYVESLNRNIERLHGVDSIRSMTRPTGEVLEQLYVTEQLGSLAGGLQQIQAGLAAGAGASVEGSTQLQDGLSGTIHYLQQTSESQSARDTGLFVPPGTLEQDQFAQVLSQYTFAEGRGIILEVILANDPYSPEAIETLKLIKDEVGRSVVNTPFDTAEVAYGGITSINSDLNDISLNDFSNTTTIMLVSLFIVLAILFRSLIMPLYMLGSLLLTYYTSIALAEIIFVDILGYDGISWAVPFFAFSLLVALGVDYSIFLLDRFREEANRGLSVREAMRISMTKMGTVVITAAIILAGTFAAMMPSGVLSLMQIATIVLIGLLLYGLIVLPLLIPAISVSFDRGVWWPFKKK